MHSARSSSTAADYGQDILSTSFVSPHIVRGPAPITHLSHRGGVAPGGCRTPASPKRTAVQSVEQKGSPSGGGRAEVAVAGGLDAAPLVSDVHVPPRSRGPLPKAVQTQHCLHACITSRGGRGAVRETYGDAAGCCPTAATTISLPAPKKTVGPCGSCDTCRWPPSSRAGLDFQGIPVASARDAQGVFHWSHRSRIGSSTISPDLNPATSKVNPAGRAPDFEAAALTIGVEHGFQKPLGWAHIMAL